jgi:hypothetical protein
MLTEQKGCCSNPPHLYVPARLLESTIKDGSGIRKQDAGGAFGAVARNEIGNEMAFHFMRSNFLRMKEQWVYNILYIVLYIYSIYIVYI